MHFEGSFEVKAKRPEVFDFLLEPKKISACMPDLQKLTVKSPDDYTAVVKAGVAFIKGDFTIHFVVSDKQVPAHAKLTGRGTGIGSTVDLTTIIDLEESKKGTLMKWSADALVGGRIASVGQRLLSGQAEKIIKELFGCLQKQLGSM